MRTLLTLILLIAPLATTRLARAGTRIVVDSLADNLTVDGKCTLREALVAANADVVIDTCAAGNGADEIILPPGEIQLVLRNTTPYPDGLPYVISSDLTLTGAGASTSRIKHVDGFNGVPTELPGADILVVSPTTQAAIAVTVRDLSLESSARGVATRGINSLASLTVDHVSLYRLQLGIAHVFPGRLTVQNSTFSYMSGDYAISTSGDLTVNQSRFENSTFISAINITGSGSNNTAVISDSTFGNIRGRLLVTSAGTSLRGVSARMIEGPDRLIEASRGLVISDSSLRQFMARGSCFKGGCLPTTCMIQGRGDITIFRTSFVDFQDQSLTNQWPVPYFLDAGRASVCADTGTLLISNSAFANHRHTTGELLGLKGTVSATIQNTTIFNTDTPTTTSVFYSESPLSKLSIVNTTIASTTAPVFAHAGQPENFIIANTIVTTTAACGDQAGLNKITSGGGNLLSDASCLAAAQPSDLITTTTGLGPLTRLNDTTYVLPLEPGSPALDAGSPVSASLETDQRGMPRSFGGARADIGAYERVDEASLKRVWLPVTAR
jgi:CSLREA domain-containing protein